jgi:protein-ribulosamine 3-kinase
MELLGSTIVEEKIIGGGCIAHARMVRLADGRRVFVKSQTDHAMFRAEAMGLAELAKTNAFAVPKVLMYDREMLVTEFVEQGNRPTNFMEDFGRRFALLHQFTGISFGFTEDNFIGSTPQQNIAAPDERHNWASFFFNKRLLFQFKLAERNGFADGRFRSLFGIIEDKISTLIDLSDESPSLLHGDLWAGNFVINLRGEPVLIDPAVYYGNREADMAMPLLFGGFSAGFYSAYNEVFPLRAGWEYRQNLYKLYHMLNHLNIFGSAYYSQALELMRFYA